MSITLVIPVHNEERCLFPLWARVRPVLERMELPRELIFIDDGSTDRSLDRLRRIAGDHPDVRLIRLDRQRGQTAALDAGRRAARGDWIATLDADLQNPPEELPRLLDMTEGYDLVYGLRTVRHDDRLTRLSSWVGNRVRDAITGHRVRDSGCSLKLMRRSALEQIPLYDGMHRFLPTLFSLHGFRVLEVAVAHEPRVAGSSKYGIGNRLWTGLVDCFAVRWMRRRRLRYETHELRNVRREPQAAAGAATSSTTVSNSGGSST